MFKENYNVAITMINALNPNQMRWLVTALCFLSDGALLAWIYFKASSFRRFGEFTSPYVTSPNHNFELYTIFLQSITFMLALFFLTQATVYLISLRKSRSASFYLKYYCVLMCAISFIITVKSTPFALLPAIIYAGGYYVFAKLFKETTVKMQTLPQSPTLE